MTCRQMRENQRKTVVAPARGLVEQALRAALRAQNGPQFLAGHTVAVVTAVRVGPGEWEVEFEVTDIAEAPAHSHGLVAA